MLSANVVYHFQFNYPQLCVNRKNMLMLFVQTSDLKNCVAIQSKTECSVDITTHGQISEACPSRQNDD